MAFLMRRYKVWVRKLVNFIDKIGFIWWGEYWIYHSSRKHEHYDTVTKFGRHHCHAVLLLWIHWILLCIVYCVVCFIERTMRSVRPGTVCWHLLYPSLGTTLHWQIVRNSYMCTGSVRDSNSSAPGKSTDLYLVYWCV